MLLASKSESDLKGVKTSLKEEFDMKDLGESKRILEIEINRKRNKGSVTISQSNYCSKILKRFKILDAKPVTIPLANLNYLL